MQCTSSVHLTSFHFPQWVSFGIKPHDVPILAGVEVALYERAAPFLGDQVPVSRCIGGDLKLGVHGGIVGVEDLGEVVPALSGAEGDAQQKQQGPQNKAAKTPFHLVIERETCNPRRKGANINAHQADLSCQGLSRVFSNVSRHSHPSVKIQSNIM